MNKENQEKLFNDFPELFKENEFRIRRWGIGCGDGWFNIIYNLCKELDRSDPPVILQVKEKFGLLRIYISNGTKEDWEKIAKAESLSSKTCEFTGKPGKLYTSKNGWLKTLSPEYAEENEYILRR